MSSPPTSHDDFAELYAGCHLELLRYVLTLLPDRHLAEDVVQETARVLWRKFDQYNRSRPFWPWARGFAHLEVLKVRRRLAVTERCFSDELVERLAEERVNQEDILARQREALAGCVEKLDGESRQLLANRYASDNTLQQFAQQQGKSANALYLMLHRIRLRLIECVQATLKREGWA